MLYNNCKGKGISFSENPITNNVFTQQNEIPSIPPAPPGSYFWVDSLDNSLVTNNGDFLIFNVS